MSIRLIVTFQLLPGKGKQYAEAFAPIVRETRREPGCEQYELFASTQDPDKVVLIERWSDQAALDTHMGVMRAREMSAVMAMRAAAPVMERFEI
ncbi:MAG: hypothetical protein A3I01_18120 [Betaproteobacteria bacterium RIFCSPLOWO2_02_FULL_65_24]|nr:MAG: hypothetical protein A3I01_18120 [Betaproteobacteria bacterium RIFCSPLOWO2_02_FULL_65_24]OGA35726.1 MAG: hypothetical protein A3G80_05605 [Betaproteobacteria bacterium RIFCSPLOWO2_12_FULL_62_13b]